jgi:hypothetical protein
MRTLIASSVLVAIALADVSAAAFAQGRQEESPQNRFCLEIRAEGQARCAYKTLAQCERARPRGSTERCFDRTYLIAATPPGDTAAPRARSRSPRGHAKGGSSSSR